MDTAVYFTFTERLTANLQADERVLGLVLLGSTAVQSHKPDQWSDHDFFIITKTGTQSHFRTIFDWLPDHASIVLTAHETAHGLKILYANGHLLEYAVFDREEIKLAKANDYVVVFDKGGVEEAMRQIAVDEAAGTGYTPAAMQRDLGMVLSLLVVGAGRVARGEAISGQVFIRTYALGHLLPLLVHVLPADEKAKSRLDNLDPHRRFEQAFPVVGAQINAALRRDPIQAALGLLDVYATYLHTIEGYPAAAVAVVRAFLGRINVA